ncbi:MAG: aspartate-semialdehyde dehydrogenase [Dehalococcoidia bacterium SM23_28_2]|nr:MAG: aspartate-semialdehyde dehydrogenase [Dehalococcoidia bacterium SM23_28_2]
MSRELSVAIVGATGLVGRELVRLLFQRHFPIKALRLLASSRSQGKKLLVGEQEIEVQETSNNSFAGADIAFFGATPEISRNLVPAAVKAGAVVIDDSPVWRMEPDVPLVVPEVNGDDLEQHRGVVAIPNSSTTPVVLALWPIHQVNPIKRVIVDTYQAVSATGARAVAELTEQARAVLDGKNVMPHVYPHQIAFNLLPEIDVFLDNGYTKEEWKMVQETRKIMHEPELAISATCVRVPVFVANSAAVHVELSHSMSADEIRNLLREAPGITVQDEPSISLYPQPWTAAARDSTFVGRIRQDVSHPNGFAMWVVSDNLRKGAALNSIQIGEDLIARNLI